MPLAENAPNDSAQSPAWSTNALPSLDERERLGERARLAREHERRDARRARRVTASSAVGGPVRLLRGGVVAPGVGRPGLRRGAAAAVIGSGLEVRAGRTLAGLAAGSIWSAWRRRISSNCCWAIACWVNSVAWMPWKRPSSQPTSWACAIRSSDSLGVSAPKGSTTSVELVPAARARGCRRARAATSRRSRAAPCGRRRRAARGAPRRASSRTIDAMRMSLVGRRTCSSGSSARVDRRSRRSASGAGVGQAADDLGHERVATEVSSRRPAYRVRSARPRGSGATQSATSGGRRPCGPGGAGSRDVVEPVRLGVAAGLADPALAGAAGRHDREHGVGDLRRPASAGSRPRRRAPWRRR